jgi:hypothetical protein
LVFENVKMHLEGGVIRLQLGSRGSAILGLTKLKFIGLSVKLDYEFNSL